MGNDEVVIAVALISAIIVLIVVKIVEFFVRFNDDTRYITREMRRAYSDGEYRYWRRELRCHYLCLIPFVNERNVLKLYNLIFYKPKHQSVKKRTDGMWHILAPSLICVCLCTVCLCGVSWAWFTATQTSSIAGITAATYTVNVTAAIDETQVAVANNGGTHTIEIENNKTYEITIAANGTAKTGFCTVTLGDEPYHTTQIVNGTPFIFKVKTNQDEILTITSQWGTCAESNNIITSNSQIPISLVTESYTIGNHNTTLETTQPSADTPQASTPRTDDTTEPVVAPQGEKNTTTPYVENTTPETTSTENKTEPTYE